MPAFEWFIGLRYMRAKRRNNFIAFISLISIIGIALGVAALIIVLSVMNGFQKEIRARILNITAPIEITGLQHRLAHWQDLHQSIQQQPFIQASAPFVRSQALLNANGNMQGAIVRGIDPALEQHIIPLAPHITAGSLTQLSPGAFGIVLGQELAYLLKVKLGDYVTVITPKGQITPVGLLPRYKRFRVVGIFRIDMYQYDANIAFIAIADAQKLLNLGTSVSGLSLKIADPLQAPYVAQQISQHYASHFLVSDWSMENANYFRAVQIEKRMMFIILTLIVAVAAFNLVSTLVMAVTEKQADIAILRTLGASPASIMRIFMIQGGISGLLGTGLGVTFGLIVASRIADIVGFFENLFGVKVLSPQVYFISNLPSQIESTDVISISCIALILAFLATLYPSWRAAHTNPAEALRYE